MQASHNLVVAQIPQAVQMVLSGTWLLLLEWQVLGGSLFLVDRLRVKLVLLEFLLSQLPEELGQVLCNSAECGF